jgi:hypothetical protein
MSDLRGEVEPPEDARCTVYGPPRWQQVSEIQMPVKSRFLPQFHVLNTDKNLQIRLLAPLHDPPPHDALVPPHPFRGRAQCARRQDHPQEAQGFVLEHLHADMGSLPQY